MEESRQFGYWGKTSEEVLESQFPLHRACRDGNVERLSLLLGQAQHGIYVEDSFYGWTPAHWASYFGKLNCLMKLLEWGMNCDVTTVRFNQTPAHIAAFSSHSHCLKWLLHCGATIDKQDYLGETPVHKAARTGTMECVSLLVSHGAKLDILNNQGDSPSEVAGKCGFPQCAQYLSMAEEQHRLRTQGMNGSIIPVPHHPTQQQHPTNNEQKSDFDSVIAKGLNGGLLPNGTSRYIPVEHNNGVVNGGVGGGGGDSHHHNDCDMDTGDQEGGAMAPAANGHHTNGFGVVEHNGLSVQGINGGGGGDATKDVLMQNGVSQNMVAVGGRKRLREDCEENEYKRIRRGEPLVRDLYSGLAVKFGVGSKGVVSPQHQVSTSALEHHSTVSMQQGYDNLFEDIIMYHG